MQQGALMRLCAHLTSGSDPRQQQQQLARMDFTAAPPAVRLQHELEILTRAGHAVDMVSRLLDARECHAWSNALSAPQLTQARHVPPTGALTPVGGTGVDSSAPPPPPAKRAKVASGTTAPGAAPIGAPARPTVAPMPAIATAKLEHLPVVTLDEYLLREDDNARYVRRIKQGERGTSEDSISKLPPLVEQLAWVNTIEDDQHKLWFNQLQHVIAATGKEFPKLEVLSRDYIAAFLRAPEPRMGDWERPCCGITDIKTKQHIPCESMTMMGGGFTCRELLMPSVLKRVRRAQEVVQKAVKAKQPAPVESTPHFVLPRERQMCFLCHLHVTNSAYLRAQYSEDERVGPAPAPPGGGGGGAGGVRIINGFCVMVNKPGEYKIEATLPGYETHYCGVAGPFPAYQRANYIPVTGEGGIRGWLEADSVVF